MLLLFNRNYNGPFSMSINALQALDSSELCEVLSTDKDDR